jgi:hypothetical protein
VRISTAASAAIAASVTSLPSRIGVTEAVAYSVAINFGCNAQSQTDKLGQTVNLVSSLYLRVLRTTETMLDNSNPIVKNF